MTDDMMNLRVLVEKSKPPARTAAASDHQRA